MKQKLYLILLCTVLTLMTGCMGKKSAGGEEKMTETVWNARENLEMGLEYDRAGQMRLPQSMPPFPAAAFSWG